MGTFFKTFIICLILCVSFLIYKFVGTESFDGKLDVAKTNPVFLTQKPTNSDQLKTQKTPTQIEQKQEDNNSLVDEDKAYSYNCYFFTKNGQMTALKRELNAPVTLENVLYLLLKGPTTAEIKKGIYTEIPQNTRLISVKNNSNSIIVNLSSAFGSGGGTESVENRVKQLSKTVKKYYPNKKIYLYIDNKEVEYLGGEGVYIKQPLE